MRISDWSSDVCSSDLAPKKEKAPRALRAREKAAFTLRLDAARHLRLRLASAVTNRSSQVILTDLPVEYLASLPDIDAMASRLAAARPARVRRWKYWGEGHEPQIGGEGCPFRPEERRVGNEWDSTCQYGVVS